MSPLYIGVVRTDVLSLYLIYPQMEIYSAQLVCLMNSHSRVSSSALGPGLDDETWILSQLCNEAKLWRILGEGEWILYKVGAGNILESKLWQAEPYGAPMIANTWWSYLCILVLGGASDLLLINILWRSWWDVTPMMTLHYMCYRTN